MKMKHITALVLASALVLAGCGGNAGQTATQTSAGGPAAEGTQAPSDAPAGTGAATDSGNGRNLVIAVNNNFITLDTHASRDSLTNSVNEIMYESLVRYDDDLNLVPNLAESFEISDDALVYTFKLKEGIMFHDGELLTAEVVKANIDRVMNPDKALRQARTFSYAEEINILDDYTLEVKLRQPYMAFLSRLEAFRIISPAALENEDKLPKNPVGTGQFRFVEWVEGDHMTVEKNPDWRNADQIQVDTITFKFVPENGTRVAMLETGEADIIYPMPNEMVSKIEANSDLVLEVRDSTVCRYVTMNQNVKPFDDVRVRQALNYAIDKDAFIAVVKGGYGNKLNSAMSPVLPYYVEHEEYAYNIEKAKELLTEAGYPDGFEATIWGNTESETVRGMNFIEQQLSLIGVKLNVMPLEEGTLSTKVYDTTPETTELQMWYVSWSAMDPDNAIRSTFHSEMYPPTGANTNYYKNLTLDEAINNGNASTAFEQQYQYYKIAQDEIWNDAVWVFMGVDQSLLAMNSRVTGAKLSSSGSGVDLKEVGLK